MELKRTLKERKFIDAYIKNKGNATQAYIEISPDCKEESARVLGYRWLQKVNISVEELLDKMEMTDGYLSGKLYEGLDATKVISVIPIPPKKSQENNTDLPEANSKNIEFIDVPDYNVRVKYLDMALKLKGKFPSEKHDVKVEGELIITDAKRKLVDKIAGIVKRTGEDEIPE